MFASPSSILVLFFSLFLLGQVAAAPLPMPVVAVIESSIKRQTIPEEVAVKSDGNNITAYKRQTIPEEEAVKSDGTNITPYKRQDIPEEEAVKSDGSNITPYKRHGGIPLGVAVRSVNGVVELYQMIERLKY